MAHRTHRRSPNQPGWCQDSVPKRQATGIALRGRRKSRHEFRLLASRAASESSSILGTSPRVLVLDKWTCNSDGRQAIFWKAPRRQRYSATFIDQGYCFNAGEWTFPDSPLRGAYANNCVYEGVTGWEAFEPTLSQSRRDGCGHHLAVCGRDSRRVVRRRSGRSESVGGGAAPSSWGDSEVDRRIS